MSKQRKKAKQRSRTKSGRWRKKRSDAGQKRLERVVKGSVRALTTYTTGMYILEKAKKKGGK